MAVLRRDHPEVNFVKRDIYNATAKLSRAQRESKSPAEALIDGLKLEKAEEKIHFDWRPDKEGHIAMLFVADTRSVEYLNQHPYIYSP